MASAAPEALSASSAVPGEQFCGNRLLW